MGSFLPFVAALLLAALALQLPPSERTSLPGIALLLGGYFAAGRAAAGFLAGAAIRDREDPTALARFHRAAALHRQLALPMQALVLWPGGWSAVALAVPHAGGLVALLLAFLPWPLFLLASRAATWPSERALGLEHGSFAGSVSRRARIGALVVVPILLSSSLFVAAALLAEADVFPVRQAADLAARYDFVLGILLLSGFALVLLFFPVLAMRILGARPMPPGPLRDRLEAYARRVGLAYRDLYLWDTQGTLPNAAVMGIGRRLRCVVFTDALLDRLDDEQAEAVFAHEAGHALHHHIPLFFVFTVAWILAVSAAGRLLPAEWSLAVRADPVLGYGVQLAGIAVYFGVIFGFVSRRLEQQADVHGLLTTGLPEGEDPAAVVREPERHPFLRAVEAGAADPGAHPFVASLERLAASMGGIREITGWRHFSIADRVDFLRLFLSDSSVRLGYAHRLRALLAVLGAVFLIVLAVAAADLPLQLRGPDPEAALVRAESAIRRGDPAAAREWLEAGLRGAEARGLTLSPLSRPLPPGSPVAEVSLLEFAGFASTPGPGRQRRFQARACEALLRSSLGLHEEAIAAAEDAVARIGDPATLPEGDRDEARRLRRRGLEVAAEVLRRAGRNAAAEAALREAGGE